MAKESGIQYVYAVTEAVAMHNLLHYARKSVNDREERLRLYAGAGMASLGFLFGPELQEYMSNLKDEELSEATKQRFIYTAAGGLIGSMLGATAGPELGEQLRSSSVTKELASRIESTLQGSRLDANAAMKLNASKRALDNRENSAVSGLIVIASAGWLGYSLFFDGKTPEEQKRHLWGLGAGAVGYVYGPRVLHKIQNLSLPSGSAAAARELYSRGGMAIGAVGGGLLGWYKGRDIATTFKQRSFDDTELPKNLEDNLR